MTKQKSVIKVKYLHITK